LQPLGGCHGFQLASWDQAELKLSAADKRAVKQTDSVHQAPKLEPSSISWDQAELKLPAADKRAVKQTDRVHQAPKLKQSWVPLLQIQEQSVKQAVQVKILVQATLKLSAAK